MNIVGYLGYLVLTSYQFEPKLTMSFLYLTGVIVSYYANSRWTFFYHSLELPILAKYLAAHTCGYIINFVILFICVDKMGYKHSLIQFISIIIVALFLFIVFKYIVFVQACILQNPTTVTDK